MSVVSLLFILVVILVLATAPLIVINLISRDLSLSSSAPHLFGDRLGDFAGEVRALLASRSAEGIFWDWPGDTEVMLARKPG